MMYQGPSAFADAVRRQYSRLDRPPLSGDALIVRIEENGVDVRLLDDTELDTLCKERKRT